MANERTSRGHAAWVGIACSVAALALMFNAGLPASAAGRTQAQKSAVRTQAARQAASGARAKEEQPLSEAGRRDPFKLPPPPGKGGEEGVVGPLPPGKRGLVIGRLRLEGIVREDTTNTMIAVVTNETDRAYFLRQNDEVYNGVVSKITPDSVYFRENTLESNGRVASREVVKKLGSGPGEGR